MKRSPSPINTKETAHMHQASQASWRRFIRSVLLAVFTHLGSRTKPQRDMGGLHHSPPTRSSFADGFSTSLGDGIFLMIITTLLSELFALYLPAQLAGYPSMSPRVALP